MKRAEIVCGMQRLNDEGGGEGNGCTESLRMGLLEKEGPTSFGCRAETSPRAEAKRVVQVRYDNFELLHFV